MPFKLFGMGGGGDRFESIEAKVQTMLRHDRHEFDLAMAALLGDRQAADVNAEIRSTDQQVNRMEREIRREVLVHTTVLGGVEIPAVLVYMSIVKDVERVGDYAKNLVDLARDGANFGTLPGADGWRELAADISAYIEAAAAAFRSREPSRCRGLIARGDRLLSDFDAEVTKLVAEGADEPQAVARALAFRYLKRVVAHLMNLVSAAVMPVDKIDYFDEDPEDRSRT